MDKKTKIKKSSRQSKLEVGLVKFPFVNEKIKQPVWAIYWKKYEIGRLKRCL